MINNKILKLSTILISFFLSGCVVSGGNDIENSNNGEKKAGYEYFLFKGWGMGASGTTTPISKNYSLTTRNVAGVTNTDIESYNNLCGIVLIKQDNSEKEIPKLNFAKELDKVTMYGYDYYTAKIKESKGEALNWVYNKNYTNDDQNCKVFLSTAGADTGMFGGPVYNDKNELIGVIIQTTEKLYLNNKDAEKTKIKDAAGNTVEVKDNYKYFDFNNNPDKPVAVNYSVFVPIQEIIGWLKEKVELGGDHLKTEHF